MFEDMLIKYLWSTIGLVAQAVPVFWPNAVELMATAAAVKVDGSAAARTQRYITNKRLMISLADAGGRIMYSYKDLAELAGYTARVADMIEVFADMKKARYEKVSVSDEFSLSHIRGAITCVDGVVKMDGIPVASPNGDLLVKDLSFSLKPGDHLMVTGPNGCGKSSLVRILAQLWPVFRGGMEVPKESDIFFVPQRPYLCIGSLRDQYVKGEE